MCSAQFIRIVFIQVNPNVCIMRLILGDHRVQYRVLNFHGNGTICCGCFLKRHIQNGTDHIVRHILRIDKVPQRIGNKRLILIRSCQPLRRLRHMRVGAND